MQHTRSEVSERKVLFLCACQITNQTKMATISKICFTKPMKVYLIVFHDNPESERVFLKINTNDIGQSSELVTFPESKDGHHRIKRTQRHSSY